MRDQKSMTHRHKKMRVGMAAARILASTLLAGRVLIGSSTAYAGAAAPATEPATEPATPTIPAGSATLPATSAAGGNGAPAAGETWNFHVQNTDTVQGYPAFSAKYSGRQSLPRGGETRETVSLDLMGGLHLWPGAEAHVDALMWQGFGLANTTGVDGFPSGEAYRIGTQDPNATIARLFVRQTIGLGGDQEDVADDAFNLASKRDISRLTFTLGRFAAADIFDTNTYANSPRTQFMNWSLVNNVGWDYPADTIGYDTGFTVELNQPDWTLRYGVFEVPDIQNGMTYEDAFLTWPYDPATEGHAGAGAFAMALEFERRYQIESHPGAIRFLAYVNRANMASYSKATAILQANGPGADLGAAHAYRNKYGFGLNWEQEIAKNTGLFSRLGWNDGQEQSWMFNDVDYTASLGISINGDAWHRPGDTYGLAGVLNGISKSEQHFFQAGGLGILAGDGNLDYGWEKIIETYYNFQVLENAHVTLDYQFISDPAFNKDRGPVSVFAVRVHWEF